MELHGKYKKRYRIIIFIFLPICLAIGFFLSTQILEFAGYSIDRKGKIIMLLSLIPLYVMGGIVAKREVLKHQRQDVEM